MAAYGKVLIFTPTFNERENVAELYRQIRALPLEADILFVDDASPDGTGEVLDQLAAADPAVNVIHRSGKLGIGSAHLCGIRYAYESGYDWLVTMDSDFSHSPSDIPALLAAALPFDMAVGSRYIRQGSLPGWSPFRRFLTQFAHFLTKTLLGLAADASGAFRAYNLRSIPWDAFEIVVSPSYSFFFESLFVLARNGYRITEIPIVLPARVYGHSKLTFREAFRSFRFLGRLALDRYRRAVIRPNLERVLRRAFPRGSRLLHAGCGSAQVDEKLHEQFRITAADISPNIFALPYADGEFDGVYSLGVVEHFPRNEIVCMLREFRRILKPGGKVILIWPHKLDARAVVEEAGLKWASYDYGPRNGFIQAVVVGEK